MAPCPGLLPSGAVDVENRLLPALVGLEPDFFKRRDAHALHRVPVAELPGQVVAGNKVAQPRVKGRDVVILKIDLDEGLPVVVALVHLDMVELVAGEIELIGHVHAGQVGIRRARPLEEQAVPVFELRLVQVQARILRKMRGADQLPAGVVGPAVDRADDVALQLAGALQHDRLTVAADVGHLPETLAAAVEQQLAVVTPLQRTIIHCFGHHQLMSDITGTGIEDQLFLQFEDLLVEIPVNRQLGNCGGQTGQGRHVGHSTPPAGFKRAFYPSLNLT